MVESETGSVRAAPRIWGGQLGAMLGTMTVFRNVYRWGGEADVSASAEAGTAGTEGAQPLLCF